MKLLFLFSLFVFSNAFFPKKFLSSLLLSSTFLNSPTIPLIQNIEQSQPSNIRVNNNNVYFYGSITSESSRALSEILMDLDTNANIFRVQFQSEPPPINLHIQSEGGSLINTFYLVDLIENLQSPVNTYIDGYVASAGSLLSVVGKKRFMTKNSFMLIHQLSSSSSEGKYNELGDSMENLNKFMETLKKIYLRKTNIPSDKLNEILEHDLWMNSQECLDYGLIDSIN